MKLHVNGQDREVEAPAEMPLLWVLRDLLGIHRNQVRLRHGPVRRLHGPPRRQARPGLRHARSPRSGDRKVLTIEGLSPDGSHPVQQAWAEVDVVQCGYCQSGQIMTAVALLAANPQPTDADIDAALSGNICRCGTYQRIREAVHKAAGAGRG